MRFFLLVLGFWSCCVVCETSLVFCFGFIYGLFLFFRFKDVVVEIMWILLCVLSLVLQPSYIQAVSGQYRVISLKQNYCLASNNQTTVLIYTEDSVNFDDVFTIESFETVHSVSNLHQFCFQDYLNRNNIYEYADEYELNQSGNSIKSKLYTYFSSKKNASYYLLYLYGIYDEDIPEILSRLSIPLLMVLYWIEKLLKKKFSNRFTDFIVMTIAIFFGLLFTFKVSLIRYILFKLGRVLFSKWEHSFSFSLFLFLCLRTECASEFSLVFPISIQLLNRFTKSKKIRTILSYFFLIFFQFLYFHEVDIILTLFFSMFRIWNGSLFMLSIVCPFLFDMLISCPISFPSYVIHFTPDFIYIFVFLVFIICFYKKKKSCIALAIFLCFYPFLFRYLDPFFHVYMIDIGQGDCTLIVEPFNKSVIMIDCGQNSYRDNVKDIIVPILEDLHINRIDYLIVTHDDFDHSGGVDELKEHVDVKNLITESSQIIDVKYPFYSLLENREVKDENDKSIISYFSYDNLTYLWMGDASVDIEDVLLRKYSLKADVLKLGHHGSNTSSSYSFLEEIECRIGLISVGYNNSYGHPSNRVIQDCHKLGINVLETKDVGMIHIFTWKFLSCIHTSNGYITVYNS